MLSIFISTDFLFISNCTTKLQKIQCSLFMVSLCIDVTLLWERFILQLKLNNLSVLHNLIDSSYLVLSRCVCGLPQKKIDTNKIPSVIYSSFFKAAGNSLWQISFPQKSFLFFSFFQVSRLHRLLWTHWGCVEISPHPTNAAIIMEQRWFTI